MPNSSHTRSTPDNPAVGLRLSEEKFRSIVDASPMSIHTYHLDSDGQLIFSGGNPAADRTLGIKHNELIGQTIEQAFPALLNTEIPKRYRDVIESGKTWFSEQIDYQDNRIKGAFEVHAFRISSDSLAVMFLEITRRKKTERALQESEARFKTLFEFAPDGYYLLDLNGVFIDGNRKAEELIGYEREELIGKNFLELDLLPMDQLQLAAEMLERNKKGFTTGPKELVLRHKLGRKVHIEITSLPIELKGAKTVLGIARDITERKKAEKTQLQLQTQLQLAQKMEALGSLAGGIAHDFNNILSAIIGYTEIALVDVVDNPELQENLEKVRQAGNRAKELVKQILTFSRQSEIESKPVKVRLVVKEALKLLRPTLPATIEIHEHIDSEAAVMADPIQIHQVMMNLCTNAAHAMAAEGGILSVSLRDTRVDERLAGKYPGLSKPAII
jgi:PAS domain S-box-containing protein